VSAAPICPWPGCAKPREHYWRNGEKRYRQGGCSTHLKGIYAGPDDPYVDEPKIHERDRWISWRAETLASEARRGLTHEAALKLATVEHRGHAKRHAAALKEAERRAADWKAEREFLPLIRRNRGLEADDPDPEEWDLKALKASMLASKNGRAGNLDLVDRARARWTGVRR